MVKYVLTKCANRQGNGKDFYYIDMIVGGKQYYVGCEYATNLRSDDEVDDWFRHVVTQHRHKIPSNNNLRILKHITYEEQ